MSSTIMACTPVSISGWYSARCGTPQSRSSSGSSRCNAPHSRNTSNMREGLSYISPVAISCQTRSETKASTSPLCTIWRINVMVSGATLKSLKRAAKRAKRRIRTGSSAKAGETWRSTLASISRTPPQGSISCALSSDISVFIASIAIELIVRSRRDKSCSSVTSGAAWKAKPW